MSEIKGYKGFNQGLVCAPVGNEFQYEIGKTYETDIPIKACNHGFHFCELPHQVFNFYAPGENHEFAIVTGSGKHDTSECDKVVSSKITIEETVSVFDMVKVSVKCFFDKFKFKEKIESADTTNAGNYGAANAGNYGAANAGNRGAAIVRHEGMASVQEKGCAVAFGNKASAKGGMCSVLVLTEWDEYCENIVAAKAIIVDGKNVKADTYYTLSSGKVVEVNINKK